MKLTALTVVSLFSWNQHWYARCWELIEKYDPDMFNNDAPFPDEKRGRGLGVKLFSAYLNRDRSPILVDGHRRPDVRRRRGGRAFSGCRG